MTLIRMTGIGLAPEERKAQGLLLDLSVAHNVTLSSYSAVMTKENVDQYLDVGFDS